MPTLLDHHAAKLSTESIREIRGYRHRTGSDWETIGLHFDIHPKTVYRICTGRSRPEVDGHIEADADCAPVPFKRCPTCGGKVKLPCRLCCQRFAEAWNRHVLEVVRDVVLELGIDLAARPAVTPRKVAMQRAFAGYLAGKGFARKAA